MQGMFRANGGCGFVKKPDILMNADEFFDPKGKSPVKKTLKACPDSCYCIIHLSTIFS